ncbi:Universal stress protein signature [Acididesulfobacillus acetoxydans]|uniref:Universal stress protein n=1 Tax=Acididesulfobacillus acetoxydans TaxID=1561005 RepID=A0A8S0Y263_9FIRM|nr:universal stress protein [Acididesulfobacillus acetoxydans]CAA7600365.1 Universal stress protein signature [Acididesulfobacillus acetoxydans]CEJ07887.1 Universal stress protein [Acididesulfobacillus acetoxydans]
MSDPNFNVLLYSDGSLHSFSAAVYTARLMQNMPYMHLTVVQVQEHVLGSEYRWIDTWPISPNSAWMKKILEEADEETKKEYSDILKKTQAVFLKKGLEINYQMLIAKATISETADAIIDYAVKNSFNLIIMGTRGLTDLKGLIFGSVAHTMLNRSPIPVLLIKKLPQELIDTYERAAGIGNG